MERGGGASHATTQTAQAPADGFAKSGGFAFESRNLLELRSAFDLFDMPFQRRQAERARREDAFAEHPTKGRVADRVVPREATGCIRLLHRVKNLRRNTLLRCGERARFLAPGTLPKGTALRLARVGQTGPIGNRFL